MATVRDGRVLAPYGAVMTEDDTLLFDLSPYYGAATPSQHPVFLRCRPPAVTDVSGSVGVLTTRGSENYYHFLTDVLPRLELLRRAGAEPDAYVVNRSTRFQRDLLDHLGLTADRCLGDEKYPHVRADELVVPSLPDDQPAHAALDRPLAPRAVPARRRPPAPPPALRDPGQAKHTRRVENEAELVAALARWASRSSTPARCRRRTRCAPSPRPSTSWGRTAPA